MPYVLNPRGIQFTGPKWVTTPTLERALALGYQPEILEAWTWPQHGRVLLGWYERFRDASSSLDTDDPDAQAARNQAKVIRTHGIGIIGSDEHLKGKTAYSPERRLHVLAKAKANIVYRLQQIGEKTGQWPLAVATDTVLYASDDPDPVTAWPGGPAVVRPRLRPVQAGRIGAARRPPRLPQRPRLPRQTRLDPRSANGAQRRRLRRR